MTWNGRAYVGSVLGIDPDNLILVTRERHDDGSQVAGYARADNPQTLVARLVVAGPIRPLDPAEPDGYYEIRLDTGGEVQIPPKVSGAEEIEFG